MWWWWHGLGGGGGGGGGGRTKWLMQINRTAFLPDHPRPHSKVVVVDLVVDAVAVIVSKWWLGMVA